MNREITLYPTTNNSEQNDENSHKIYSNKNINLSIFNLITQSHTQTHPLKHLYHIHIIDKINNYNKNNDQ